MAYPDTSLPGALDPEYGGRPASEFGQPAWKWINSVVRFLARWFVDNVHQPRSTVVVTSQTSALAGQVAVFVAGNFVAAAGYDVRKYGGGLASPVALGVYLEPCSVGAKARVAVAGVVPPGVTGLGTQTAAKDAGLDTGTGFLRVAQAGDVVLGKIDLQGNTLFTGFGAPLP